MSRLKRSKELEDEMRRLIPSVDKLGQMLGEVDYLADEGLATSAYLALRLPQPLLLEGEAGVGKTELAKALAQVLDTPLIRLQCYEGIDSSEALYEWNYPRQLLSIRIADSKGEDLEEEGLFGPDYLIRRPLLEALEADYPHRADCLAEDYCQNVILSKIPFASTATRSQWEGPQMVQVSYGPELGWLTVVGAHTMRPPSLRRSSM
ncbi:MAG: MoxR family ATPase [Actinobacteria bacterium]|nr:MoxR family ATPase [Actinomycetota bacterium]